MVIFMFWNCNTCGPLFNRYLFIIGWSLFFSFIFRKLSRAIWTFLFAANFYSGFSSTFYFMQLTISAFAHLFSNYTRDQFLVLFVPREAFYKAPDKVFSPGWRKKNFSWCKKCNQQNNQQNWSSQISRNKKYDRRTSWEMWAMVRLL